MNLQDENIEQFDAYWQGLMTDAEIRAFEQRLEEDTEWAAEFEEYKQLATGLQSHFEKELKEELKAVDAEMDRDQGTSKANRMKKLAWVSSGIAASVLIALFAYNIFGKANVVELAQRHWPVEEGLPVKMSAKSKYDAAMNAFKLEQWQEAEQQLNALPESDTTAYFLGNVYFKQARFDKAAVQFKHILKPSHWHSEAKFRMALVLLAQEKTAESRAVLERIESSDSPFSADAKAVLEEL